MSATFGSSWPKCGNDSERAALGIRFGFSDASRVVVLGFPSVALFLVGDFKSTFADSVGYRNVRNHDPTNIWGNKSGTTYLVQARDERFWASLF